MNEVTTKNLYNDFDKKLLTKFKNDYKSLGTKMLDLSVEACQLSNINQEQFILFCKNELSLSKGTVSKMIHAGRIVTENPDLRLPKEYSKVYELAPVEENLSDFYTYAEENEVEIATASQKKIRELVTAYNSDGEEESEESEEEESEESEEVVSEQDAEVEEVEEEDFTKYSEVARNCIDILVEFTKSSEEEADCVRTLEAILKEIGVI